MLRINRALYRRAVKTNGFFSKKEAALLMRAVMKASDEAVMLEIGSYFGRSTLFALSALKKSQRWVIVDSFREAASYSGHSFWKLTESLSDERITLLPMTIREAYPHLSGRGFDLAFIDGDHSFLGVSQDVSLSIALLNPDGRLLCHDVCDLFPGVMATVELLQSAQVIKLEEKVGTLTLFSVRTRPTWLVDPAVFRGEQLEREKKL
jgi:predicted O-methyltransferase YrrM